MKKKTYEVPTYIYDPPPINYAKKESLEDYYKRVEKDERKVVESLKKHHPHVRYTGR